MVKELSQTGQAQNRALSLQPLRQLASLAELSGSDTREMAALTQLESWVMANPTPNTSDRAKILTHISQLWSNSGAVSHEEAKFRKATIQVIYPDYEWEVRPAGKFGYHVQSKIRF
jgi:hypothetical protein